MHHEKRAAGGKAEERGEVSGKEKEDSEYASDRKRGGHVEHEEEKREHRARGGHVRHKHARGGAPFSEAHNLTAPGNDKKTGPGESTDSIP
jgi:hypothetical protein